MTLKVGLTGGIGSGKTTVARIFHVLGIPVYYADDAAKRLMNNNESLKKEIVRNFGEKAYTNGSLNRQYIAAMVFHDKEKLNLLNELVHPVTIQDADLWMEQQTTTYAIKEAALIFESGVQASLDYIIGVSAPAPLRMLRTMKRDQLTREEVQKRMDRQIAEPIKMRLCDFVIHNDEQQPVISQVLEVHHQLMEIAVAKK